MAEAHDNPAVTHETSDVNIRAILWFGAGLAATTAAVSLIVFLLFQYFAAREARPVAPEYPLAAAQPPRLPPEPRLQTQPRADLADLRAREEQVLTTYAVDPNTGVVRIPIDEAMKLVVQRGLPARPAGTK